MMILTPTHQQILDGIARNGMSTATYAPREGSDDPDEWFTYTIGVTKTAGWPEFIIAGLPPEQAMGVLAAAIQEIWARHGPLEGMRLEHVLDDKAVVLRLRRDLKERHRKLADWYSDQVGLVRLPHMFQLLWPDREGRLPGEADCDPAVVQAQALNA